MADLKHYKFKSLNTLILKQSVHVNQGKILSEKKFAAFFGERRLTNGKQRPAKIAREKV
jgi:hypothetical protein